jgi:hypothetical protein
VMTMPAIEFSPQTCSTASIDVLRHVLTLSRHA